MEPHELVRRFAPALPRQKPVIDIATGQGRDALFLAGSGFRVLGLERSSEAIGLVLKASRAEGVEIGLVLADARSLPFKEGTAGAVLVFNFLERHIFGDLIRLLAPGGIILYETFLKRHASLGAGGPTNPAYLLDDGELYERFRCLELLFYEEGFVGPSEGRRVVARYAGRKK
jgi:SAM-dependent methyltransferase